MGAGGRDSGGEFGRPVIRRGQARVGDREDPGARLDGEFLLVQRDPRQRVPTAPRRAPGTVQDVGAAPGHRVRGAAVEHVPLQRQRGKERPQRRRHVGPQRLAAEPDVGNREGSPRCSAATMSPACRDAAKVRAGRAACFMKSSKTRQPAASRLRSCARLAGAGKAVPEAEYAHGGNRGGWVDGGGRQGIEVEGNRYPET